MHVGGVQPSFSTGQSMVESLQIIVLLILDCHQPGLTNVKGDNCEICKYVIVACFIPIWDVIAQVSIVSSATSTNLALAQQDVRYSHIVF